MVDWMTEWIYMCTYTHTYIHTYIYKHKSQYLIKHDKIMTNFKFKIYFIFSCPGGSSPKKDCPVGYYGNQVSQNAETDCQVSNLVSFTRVSVGCSSVVEHPFVVLSSNWFLLMDPLSLFVFHPVLHNWYNNWQSMCYPIYVIVQVKYLLFLINGGYRVSIYGFMGHWVNPSCWMHWAISHSSWCNKGCGMCYPIWDCSYKISLNTN